MKFLVLERETGCPIPPSEDRIFALTEDGRLFCLTQGDEDDETIAYWDIEDEFEVVMVN